MGTNAVLPYTPTKAHSGSNAHLGPSESLQQLSGHTPVAFKHGSRHYGWGHVEKSRTDVADDLGPSVHELPYQFFQDHILPPLHQNVDVQAVIRRLKKSGHITKAGRWKGFGDDPYTASAKSSSDSPKLENDVFAKLVSVVKHIVDKSGCGDVKPIVVYESLPHSNPICCFDKKKGRPDGWLIFNKHMRFLKDRKDGRRYWRDVATPAEFKLRDTRDDLQDDVQKICWNMHQVMQEDPRRRFVFAFTIENTQMRAWMANRSDVVVSEPFNFIQASQLSPRHRHVSLTRRFQDHEKFIHFFLSQTYAKEHELGIDTTMTMVAAEGTTIPTYDITMRVVNTVGEGEKKQETVEERVFQTEYLINGDGAKSLRGRGTRIWKVHRVTSDEEDADRSGVLKDVWLDEDRQGEGDILEDIRDQSDISELAKQVLKRRLLTPIAKGDVFIDGVCDGTRTLITRGATIPEDANKFPLHIPVTHQPSHARTTVSTIPSGSTNIFLPAPTHKVQRIVKYFSKRHYRIVFKEECKPLSEVKSLLDVFSTLYDITIALRVIHTSGPGWVHRDISAGNILILKESDSNDAKLSDVEYAKRLDAAGKHEIRTGTANFMSVEVDAETYLFRSAPDDSEDSEPETLEEALAVSHQLSQRALTQADDQHAQSILHAKPSEFRYNPIHDLESIWWIAVYFVVNKETSVAAPGGQDTANENQAVVDTSLTEKQLIYARSLFYTRAPRIEAVSILSSTDNPLDNHMRNLPSHLFIVCTELAKLRMKLRTHYGRIEAPGFTIDKMVCKTLYGSFTQAFKNIVLALQKQDVIVHDLPPSRAQEEWLELHDKKAAKTNDGNAHGSVSSTGTKRRNEDEAESSSAPKKQRPATRSQAKK
ncbi:hypothetical protein BC835DRAFT_1411725 [Cytidiella melzeri]|nr:hypothetical protein BC835DRAFT_1411725 [Cytidiella melzeri]